MDAIVSEPSGIDVRRIARLVAVTAALTVASAGLYLRLLWLPNAQALFTWPEVLALLVAPSALALALRRAPSAARLAFFVVCLVASVLLTYVGAIALIIAYSD